MSDQINIDNLSDEDFMDMLENAPEVPENEDVVEENIIEDTDQAEEEVDVADEAETEDSSDDESLETEEVENTGSDEADEVNTQKDDDGQEPDTDGENTDGADGTGEEAETAKIDYKKQYEELAQNSAALQSFYDEITSDIVVNGKKTKGFSDPKMIIQAQQMAGNYNEKMRGIKQYRKFMDPIKKRGFLDNSGQFDLAMQLLDGDKEAIKKHIKDLEIDPFELDMENINYVQKNQTTSGIEIAYNDVMDNASKYGVEDEVSKVLQKDWDNESIVSLLDDPQSSADLVQHMSNGVYGAVTNRMAEKQRVDVNGVYGDKPTIEQYREAAAEIENEYKQYAYNDNLQRQQQAQQAQQEQAQQAQGQQNTQNQIEEDYKKQVSKENKSAEDARRKATSISQKKKKVQPKKISEDPMDLSDDEFEKVISAMIYK